jgi:hypothetical protein
MTNYFYLPIKISTKDAFVKTDPSEKTTSKKNDQGSSSENR